MNSLLGILIALGFWQFSQVVLLAIKHRTNIKFSLINFEVEVQQPSEHELRSGPPVIHTQALEGNDHEAIMKT